MSEVQARAVKAVSEAAAEWVVRIHAPAVSEADSKAFMEWLRRSPLHVAEYMDAERVFLALEGVAQDDSTDVDALLRQAATQIVELHTSDATVDAETEKRAEAPVRQRSTGRWSKRWTWAMAAAAAGVLFAMGSVFLFSQVWQDSHTYVTGTGEQRRIVLDDGSTVDLNTRSSLRVRYTDTSRDLELAEGEAFFSVARDPARPFRVTSGSTVVRAVGTQFNVYRQATQTVVTVVEGKVSVTESRAADHGGRTFDVGSASPSEKASAAPIQLEVGAGQEVAVAADRNAIAKAIPPVAANAKLATAWRQRRLIFEDQPLAEVVAEFNRYNRRQLVIEDAELASEPISGVFDADRPEDLIGFLTGSREVRVTPQGEGVLKIERIDSI